MLSLTWNYYCKISWSKHKISMFEFIIYNNGAYKNRKKYLVLIYDINNRLNIVFSYINKILHAISKKKKTLFKYKTIEINASRENFEKTCHIFNIKLLIFIVLLMRMIFPFSYIGKWFYFYQLFLNYNIIL